MAQRSAERRLCTVGYFGEKDSKFYCKIEMTFNDIIGQASTKQLLRGIIEGGRMPHALLLLAPQGSGGLPLALAYAQYVLCDNRSNGESCGRCANCIKSEKMIHPDIHYSYPTIGPKTVATHVLKEWRAAIAENPYLNVNQWLEKLDAENKQGNIPVAECTEIVKKLSLKTYEADYKILIMWLPEYLGKEGNRLLKMIEEPPDQTLFILVAENQDLILNTILSRCQLVKAAPLSYEDLKNGLILRGVTSGEAEAIAPLADGDFNAAVTLARQSENDNAHRFLEWMRKCYADLVNWTEDFSKTGREKQKLFLRYGLHFLRELLILTTTGNENLRLRGTELATALKMKAIITFEKIEPMAQLFDECSYHIERNANPKVLFLDASIRMHKILRNG
jgi:DNA polymerase III subunit delta'